MCAVALLSLPYIAGALIYTPIFVVAPLSLPLCVLVLYYLLAEMQEFGCEPVSLSQAILLYFRAGIPTRAIHL